MKKYLVPIGFILGTELVGVVSSLFTVSGIRSWYVFLIKPPLTPPNWIFGPVWTILYLLIGVSVYLVWRSKAKKGKKETALKIFFIQLAFNFTWSYLFFYLKMPAAALIDLIILKVLIALMIKEFTEINKTASLLLYPYLAWVMFAGYLNFGILYLNY